MCFRFVLLVLIFVPGCGGVAVPDLDPIVDNQPDEAPAPAAVAPPALDDAQKAQIAKAEADLRDIVLDIQDQSDDVWRYRKLISAYWRFCPVVGQSIDTMPDVVAYLNKTRPKMIGDIRSNLKQIKTNLQMVDLPESMRDRHKQVADCYGMYSALVQTSTTLSGSLVQFEDDSDEQRLQLIAALESLSTQFGFQVVPIDQAPIILAK